MKLPFNSTLSTLNYSRPVDRAEYYNVMSTERSEWRHLIPI